MAEINACALEIRRTRDTGEMPKIAPPKLETTCCFRFHATLKAVLTTLEEKTEILLDKMPQTKNEGIPGRLSLRLGIVI